MLRSVTAISLLLAPAFALFNPSPNVMNGQTCSGFFYEGINTFYVDCFDQIGNLVAQDENFYEFTLDKVCSVVAYSDIASQITGWRVPSGITNSTQLNCCDYYQRTVGYVFTECDQGLNAMVIPSKVNGNVSAQYQNMTTEYLPLNWNWSELQSLINQQCGTLGGSGSGSSQQLIDINQLSQVWQQLPLNWTDYNQLAQQNLDPSTFDKATLKEWIFIYGNVSQALMNFSPNASTGAGNASSGTNSSVQPVNETITQTSNSSSVGNVSASGVVNSTTGGNTTQLQQVAAISQPAIDYWLSDYDQASMNVSDVVQNLTARGIYNNFLQFFNYAFGTDGFVSNNRTGLTAAQQQNLTSSSSGSSSSINQVGVVPAGLESIVAWISQNVDQEVQQRCTACQFNTTNATSNVTPPVNVSGISNSTSNATVGAANQTVGAANQTVGAANQTVGASNVTGAASNVTGAASNATGAAVNSTIGAANSTASNITGAAANGTSAAVNSTGP